ncbi:TrmB family transcriptional regulator [Cytobacillus purgationiresistens]|uniref:Sugar-specific transcriptional regulator TrmB n=1 Tax=Cytobacillus purgationiresistens TaxID=863449 RepID=A0ABU0ALS7_9BACI|nr:helix-turn-helix domain-containing protein [Cytobacillus purgationiresistens]MDQ0271686.1 sugar-specific transcriptional regulator TrmB [Cytobacillus purgationiresistens]
MEDKIIDELQKHGFSKYECKAYIGLLKSPAITGYELSKRSSVPRSMIYEVLGKLLDKGAIQTVPSDPIIYKPVTPKQLLSRLKEEMNASLELLETSLSSLESDQKIDVVTRIVQYEHIVQEMLSMIRQAETEIWLSIWSPVLKDIEKAVREKEGTIPIFTVLFGAEDKILGHTYHHNYMAPDIVSKRMGGYLTILVIDEKEALIAKFSDKGSEWAVKSTDPALVLIATEYIRHDIMVEEITQAFGPEKLDEMWKAREDLIHVMTGKNSLV